VENNTIADAEPPELDPDFFAFDERNDDPLEAVSEGVRFGNLMGNHVDF
jgi:hypothetical protein